MKMLHEPKSVSIQQGRENYRKNRGLNYHATKSSDKVMWKKYNPVTAFLHCFELYSHRCEFS